MGVRRQSRETALQVLFMCDFHGLWDKETACFCLDHFGTRPLVRSYAEKIVLGVLENFKKIDSAITCSSEHWSISRMAKVDRAILRMATFEILLLDEIPVNVAINEAIEVAKRFGSEESHVFVNGVLDHVATKAAGSMTPRVEILKTKRSVSAPEEVASVPKELIAEEKRAIGAGND